MDKTPKSSTPPKIFSTFSQQMFAMVGLVLFLTGLVATGLLGEFNIFTIPLCLLGIAIGSVIFLPRVTRNLSSYANLFLYSLFFCLAAITFFIILQKHPLTFDATQNRTFSLSTVTSNYLQRLDRPVRATAFIKDKQDRLAASRLLGEYSRYSPQFEYRIVDPFQEAKIANQFAAQIDLGSIYLERMTTDTATKAADKVVKVGKIGEEQLTNGIVQLLRPGTVKLYFTMGHGEPDLKEDKVTAALLNQGADPNNLQTLVTGLESAYIEVEPLQLDRRESVPSDASAVVIVRPRVDFQPGEVNALRQYLDNGGRAMFLLNPDIPQLGNEVRTALTNIADLVKQFGIELPPQVVVEPLNQQKGQSIYFVPVQAKESRLTNGLPTSEPFTILPQARPVVAGTPPPNTFMETFITSDDKSWPFPIEELRRALITRTDPRVAPKEDELKPTSLGVASTRTQAGSGGSQNAGKIVVIGNGDFVTTRYLLGNQEWSLFNNSINWLTDSGEELPIPQIEITSTPMSLTQGQQKFIFILVAIAIPTLVALGGLGYSISRRGGL